MSLVKSTISSHSAQDEEVTIVAQRPSPQKVLEEDEYLDRMAKIIRRDFFSDIEFPDGSDSTPSSYRMTERSDRSHRATPGTNRTSASNSTLSSRREACSLNLNDFLKKYTSEDNAYFEKLQRKEQKRHRLKYPWLYKDKTNHNRSIREQLRLPSINEQAALTLGETSTKVVGWTHNPKNSLFYAPDEDLSKRPQSTINYHSNKYINDPLFKEPLPAIKPTLKQKTFSGFSDKIGIDGKMLNGSETPMINGFAFIPPPQTPLLVVEEPKIKSENRFYIPCDSPRDELAHRLYQEKVSKNIRTPKTGLRGTPSFKTPSSRKGCADLLFSPGTFKTSSNRRG